MTEPSPLVMDARAILTFLEMMQLSVDPSQAEFITNLIDRQRAIMLHLEEQQA